jgi:6-pyruvoyltetrahydropterin/6-carboxytetrahydropterin synthase
MPFDITATRTFSAAHQLRLYDGSLEPLHGHNWVVRVTSRRQARRSAW